jgi:hypothetical protein
MKSSLFLAALLLLASTAQAQHHHQGSDTASSQGFSNSGWGGASGGGIEYGADVRALRYEQPADLKIGYAKNDGPFVPSIYMNYDDALALGQQQLAAAQEYAKNEGAFSLGEIARAYRAVKVPTLKLQARVLQDNFGKLEVCNLNSNNCHRP